MTRSTLKEKMRAVLQQERFRHKKAIPFAGSGETQFQPLEIGHYDYSNEGIPRRIVDWGKHRHTAQKRSRILVAETLPETLLTEQKRQDILQELTIWLRS